MMRSSPPRKHRQAAWFRGQAAETVAATSLQLKGYRILARQYRTPVGEIDIVARRGGTVAFIEVKARATEQLALESIGAKQRRRIMRAAEAFIQSNNRVSDCEIRFDAILVTPWRWPIHLKDAWQNDS